MIEKKEKLVFFFWESVPSLTSSVDTMSWSKEAVLTSISSSA